MIESATAGSRRMKGLSGRRSQRLVELDSCVADVTKTPGRVLLQAAAYQIANAGRDRWRQRVPLEVALEHARDGV